MQNQTREQKVKQTLKKIKAVERLTAAINKKTKVICLFKLKRLFERRRHNLACETHWGWGRVPLGRYAGRGSGMWVVIRGVV